MINATFQVFFQVQYLWTCEKKGLCINLKVRMIYV